MKKYLSVLFCITLIIFAAVHSQGQIITTYAGDHVGGDAGDGGPATSAELHQDAAIALDAAGNLYIADFGNNKVRKVSAAGIISTIAGTGTAGYSGDGGQATDAKLYHMAGIAVDNAGNVYIADSWNNAVRKVNTSGIITTVAGNTSPGYTGNGGQATAAELDDPNNIAVDAAGNIYIADAHNNVIRKVNTSGIITTVVGNGYNAGTTLGGYSGDGGPATAAELFYPESVTFDGAGNMYIAELYNNVIRKVDVAGTISTFAGNNTAGYSGDGSSATDAQLKGPYAVAVDGAGNVFIADASNDVIRMVNTAGIISTYAGDNATPGYSGDGGPATAAGLYVPTDCLIDPAGNLYIADDENNVVRIVRPPTTGIHSLQGVITGSLTAYPNPNNGAFTINLLSSVDESATVSIINVVGERVIEINTITNKPTNVQVHVSAGTYFVLARTSNGSWYQKIMVSE